MMISSRARGFTLIEITVALSVIGILFFAALPPFANFLGALELNAVARGIVSDLRLAQSQAMTGRTTVKAAFFPKTILGAPAAYILKKFDVFKASEKTVKKVTLRPKDDFVGEVTIIFASSGYPPPGGSGTIKLKDSGARTKKIIVSSAGRIRVE